MQNMLYTTYTAIPLHKYKKAAQRRKTKLNKILLIQKLLSLFLIALSILIVKVLQDATMSIVLTAGAVCLMTTKKQILDI